MQGLVYKDHEYYDEFINTLCVTRSICVDKKIHLVQSFHESYSLHILGPCDGSCVRLIDVDKDVESAVKESIATGNFRERMISISPEESETEFNLDEDKIAQQVRENCAFREPVTIGDIISMKWNELSDHYRQTRKR